jgi:hypothetical protein
MKLTFFFLIIVVAADAVVLSQKIQIRIKRNVHSPIPYLAMLFIDRRAASK